MTCAWLFTLAATAALVLAVGCGNGTVPAGGEPGPDASSTSGRESSSRSPVEDYLRFAEGSTGADVDPGVLAEGLRTLAGALGTLSLGPPALQVDLRVAAEHVLLDPSSGATAAAVRAGLVAAAGAIQSAGGGEDGLTRVAESIRPGVPLADQAAAIREFFVQSAQALARLSRRS